MCVCALPRTTIHLQEAAAAAAMIFLKLPSESNPAVALEPVEDATAGVDDTIVTDLEGALLKSPSWFPYFMLVAIEAGSPLRAALLFLCLPLAWAMGCLIDRMVELRMLCFVAVAGIKASAVESVGRAVLAKFFLEDLNPATFRVFKACGKRRVVVTSLPVLMVEPLASHYLDAATIGSKLGVTGGGYCTGLIKMVVCGDNKARLAQEHFDRGGGPISIGIGSEFFGICKRCLCARSNPSPSSTVPKKDYIKPLVFHDGRLIQSPTPLHCLIIVLWIPIAFPLAVIRVVLGLALPKRLALPAEALLGVVVRVGGCVPPSSASTPPPWSTDTSGTPRGTHRGVLFVCTHRSLLDPVFISYARMRHVKTVTYSVSPVSELLSPIRTARLTRCRDDDARTMSRLLDTGDLAVCPEGTTCREPFLLRFSALFAELTDRIVPVGVTSSLTMFHATTARGWKALDPLFFFMNPMPGYEVRFLPPLAVAETCVGGGRASHEVANRVQRMLADSLGYQCTSLTRRDKYRMLVGNDGIVSSGSREKTVVDSIKRRRFFI